MDFSNRNQHQLFGGQLADTYNITEKKHLSTIMSSVESSSNHKPKRTEVRRSSLTNSENHYFLKC